MTFWQAIILGIVQGIFMFFPVSSTSHLALVQHLMLQGGAAFPDPDSPEMILFDLVVHVGTLISIAVVFRKSLGAFLGRVLHDARAAGWLRPRALWENLHTRLALLGLLSVAVTGAIGYPLRSAFAQIFGTPLAIAATLTITGIVLWWTDILPPRTKDLRKTTIWMAVVIGFAQALALMPGLSRSGMTIAFALFVGMRRRWAAEYSFFIAFPTILAASAIQGLEVLAAGQPTGVGLPAYLVGFVVAALVGIVALRIVLHLLYRARFRLFSYYVWALALLIVIGSFTGTLPGIAH